MSSEATKRHKKTETQGAMLILDNISKVSYRTSNENLDIVYSKMLIETN